MLVSLGAVARAFPPAPYFTVFGDVRDQYGVLIPAGGASVVAYQNGREMVRQPLIALAGADFNYQLRLQMDMLRQATATYSSKAVVAGGAYTVAVEVGGVTMHPIEMNSPVTVGGPAERRRLNLTLGTDSDGDGLPDAWEEAQLYHAGIMPGPDGWDLSLIDRNGDFDKDGVNNHQEYLSGTYATDATSTMALEIKEKLRDSVRLGFYAIHGRSYTLESSPDLKRWSPASFAPGNALAPARMAYQATTTGVIDIFSAAPAGTAYYRLTAR